MTDTIRYCAIGCTRNGYPQQTDPPAVICRRCEANLRDWLDDIPERYTLLPQFVEHGTTDRNPESKATKRAQAAAPMRLEIIDLLDTRLGRKWQGTEPTDDRRGTVGTLNAIAQEVRETRNLTGDVPTNVYALCRYLQRHLPWLATQQWVTEAHTELKRLHRALADAVGDYRPRPVGTCHVETDDADDPCGGPLMASHYGGVRCVRCGAVWDAAHLRVLGLAQAQESA